MAVFRIRESDDSNAAVDAMVNSFDSQEDPCVGPFWYDPKNDELFGQSLTLASDRPFFKSSQFGAEVRTGHSLHKTIWSKKSRQGKDKRFSGDYTQIPRGRVFEFKGKGFKVFVGDWIDKYPSAKEQIIDEFSLPEDKTEFVKDSHWNIGHGWSDEF